MSYHHGNLKESLIQAGNESLKTFGPGDFSLREVAKRAGVSHNAPYRHFRDKSDLIEKILERTLTEMADQILSAPLLYPASKVLQIQFVGRLWMHLATQHPHKASLLFGRRYISGSKNQGALSATHQLITERLATLLDNRLDLATILIATFRGLGLMHISESYPSTVANPDDLIALCDLAIENILLPYDL